MSAVIKLMPTKIIYIQYQVKLLLRQRSGITNTVLIPEIHRETVVACHMEVPVHKVMYSLILLVVILIQLSFPFKTLVIQRLGQVKLGQITYTSYFAFDTNDLAIA